MKVIMNTFFGIQFNFVSFFFPWSQGFYPEQRAEWCHHGAEDSRIARHLPGGAWQRVEHGPGSLEVAIWWDTRWIKILFFPIDLRQ